MSKPTLIHRGYLYAQKHVSLVPLFKSDGVVHVSDVRMSHAKAWRMGYLAAQVDARRRERHRAKNR